MTWTVRQTVKSKAGVQTRDYGSYPTREAAEKWLAAQVRDARGFEVAAL